MTIIKSIYVTTWIIMIITLTFISFIKLIESVKNRKAIETIIFATLILFAVSSIILKFA